MLRGRTSAVLTLALAVLTASGCGGSSSTGGTPTLNWYVFNEPSGSFKSAADKCSKESGGKYKIAIQALPTDADQQRELIVRRLAAKDSSVDIVGMDVIWTAEFAEAGWIDEWSGQNAQKVTQGVLPGPLQTARYKGKLYAAPFTSNTQILFYRKDRVKTPPKTWDEMIQQAEKIGPAQGKIQVQGARYEGLTVWFNSLVASAGGQILTNNGNTTALGPEAVQAADVIKKIAASPVADPALENAKEDDGRLGFERGDSAFEVNYTFAWASANDAVTKAPDAATKKKAEEFRASIGFARWPSVAAGQPSHVTLGGINLGVGSYGKHRDLAFEAAACLRQPVNQIPISLKGGLLPTTASLYNNAELKKAFPFTNILKAEIADGVARPVTPFYSDISQAIQRSLHPERDLNPASTIKDMKDKLDKAKKGELF
ncbi:MAG: trehalose/maltose transport system substrate-binding protein [Thermoleophilaceae bacterium]|nr:trehalose/maltose transport system substrate-binding protein [Thermoleophilaceae bacterium]